MSFHPPDPRDCPRCGNPLPVDGRYDCAGSDLDATARRNRTYSPAEFMRMFLRACGTLRQVESRELERRKLEEKKKENREGEMT